VLTKLPEDPVPSPPPHLAVVETLCETVAVLAEQWRALSAAVIGPATLSVAVDTIVGNPESWWAYLPMTIVSWSLAAIMAVACHRLVLLGPESASGWFGFRWTNRETRVVSRMLATLAGGAAYVLVTMILLAIVMGASVDAEEAKRLLGSRLVLLLTFTPILYVFDRWSLAFPAAATDRPSRLADAWQLSHGNGWRLVAVGLLPLVLFELRMMVLPPPGFSAPFSGPVFVSSVLGVVLAVVGYVLLAVTFRRLGGLALPTVDLASAAGSFGVGASSSALRPDLPPA